MLTLSTFSRLPPCESATRLHSRYCSLLGDGDFSDSDNLDLPVRLGFEQEFAATFLNYLDSQRKTWDLCDLHTLPTQSPGADALLRLLKKNKWTFAVKERPASAIPLPEAWDEYLGRLESEDRKNLNKLFAQA